MAALKTGGKHTPSTITPMDYDKRTASLHMLTVRIKEHHDRENDRIRKLTPYYIYKNGASHTLLHIFSHIPIMINRTLGKFGEKSVLACQLSVKNKINHLLHQFTL